MDDYEKDLAERYAFRSWEPRWFRDDGFRKFWRLMLEPVAVP